MALERSERQLPVIDPSSLIGRPDTEVVGPKATAALIEAYRSGVITADDILSRVGKLGQTKKKADLMALEEAISPEAQQSRALARQAQDVGNRQTVNNAQLAGQARETELQAAIFKAQAAPGNYEAKLDAITKAGINIPINLAAGLTDENRRMIDSEFADLAEYTTQQQLADQYVKGAKETTLKHVGPRGEVTEEIIMLSPDRQQIPLDKFKQAFQYRQTPYPLWKAQGKNKFGNLFGAQGQIIGAEPLVTPVDPAAAARQRAAMVNAGVPATQAVQIPDAQIPTVAPRATAPPAAKPELELGGISERGGLVTSVSEPKQADQHLIPAEGVKQLGLSQQAAQVVRNLDTAYQNLIANDPMFVGLVGGTLTRAAAGKRWNEKVAAFEREVTALLAPVAKGIYNETGVLSDKDVERYKDVLPDLRDNPAIGADKINRLTNEAKFSYQNVLDHWKRAGYDTTGFEDKMTGAPGQNPAPLSGPSGTPTTLSTGRKVVKGADGQFYEVK